MGYKGVDYFKYCFCMRGDVMTKIAIVGSRDFNDYEVLYNILKEYCFDIDHEGDSNGDWCEVLYHKHDKTIIVSGGARGADTLAEKFANEFGFEKVIFKPDWDLFGKSAGFIRNKKIVDACDVLFAFQINKSKGTQHSIDLARKAGKEVYVIEVSND